MSELIRETDVLIVGAGPPGLALAAGLKMQGVKAVVIDAQASAPITSRAAVVHARTLEMLEPLGVTPELIAQGIKVPTFRVRDRDRALVTIDFGQIPSAYQYALMCPQDRTERILLRRLEALGGGVLRPAEFVRFGSDGAGVSAEIKFQSGRSTVKAKWLVGCDGMHSVVREQAAIGFAGSEYKQSFVLADVHIDWPLSRQEVTLFLSSEGLMVVAPLPDERFRVVATAELAPETPNLEYVQSVLNRRGPSAAPGHIREVLWSSRFHVHHRLSERPHKGRVLLCGDAAHVHSPAGGQGMNTGIQDSASLANALAQSLKDGREAALEDWARERHQVAMEVVSLADRLTRIATLKSATGRLLRNAGIVFAGRLPPVRSAIAKRLAELDVS
jgi:2-polyprenyl-6-methoxyphenol hydroxylase-like FAD-dependent oxidoreductase